MKLTISCLLLACALLVAYICGVGHGAHHGRAPAKEVEVSPQDWMLKGASVLVGFSDTLTQYRAYLGGDPEHGYFGWTQIDGKFFRFFIETENIKRPFYLGRRRFFHIPMDSSLPDYYSRRIASCGRLGSVNNRYPTAEEIEKFNAENPCENQP